MTPSTESTHSSLLHHLQSLAFDVEARVVARIQAARPSRIGAAPALEPAISAERKTMRTHKGQALSYYEDKSVHGRPLVLVHSVNACASAYEMKPLFEHFRGSRPVFAPDLPGFGFSERDERPYTRELYVAELVDFLTRVKDKGDAPDVVALSLSSEFMAEVATTRPDLVHSLTFISPTGLAASSKHKAPPSKTGSPWWSKLAYAAITTRPSIRYFLGKSFAGSVDAGLLEYDYKTAHQPGGERAPIAFLRGQLFSPQAYETYAAVNRPVLVLYDQDAYTTFERLGGLLTGSPQYRARRVAPSRGMPHFEKLEETVAELTEFWSATAHVHHGHP
jgi:pimeloyl-ACP methyl ester carboxylesterase